MSFASRTGWLSLLLIAGTASADTIEGEFNFDRLPPHAAVVYVPDDNAPARVAHIDQKDIQFTKPLDISTSGTDVLFSNSDKHLHNLYASSYKLDTKFDVGLIPPGQETRIPVTWPENSLIRVGCNIHSNMRTYVANIRSNHFTLVDFVSNDKKFKRGYGDDNYKRKRSSKALTTKAGKYRFELADVPSDQSKVSVLLPHYELTNVELRPGETKTIPLLRRGKEKGQLTLTRSL